MDKKYSFEEACKIAKETGSVIISEVTKDKYKFERTKDKYEIKFFSSTIDSWRKCNFILTEEIVNGWYVKEEGDK